MKFKDLNLKNEGRVFNNVPADPIIANLDIAAKLSIDDVSFHLSKAIDAPFRGNSFFVCAVEKEGVFRLRTIFLSRSQGVWRMLTAYKYKVRDDGSEKPKWNDKGYGEQSIMMPIALQEKLFNLSKEKGIEIEDSVSVFYGIAPLSGEDNWYKELVSPEPQLLSFVNYDSEEPETLTEEDFKPELSLESSWEINNSLYGDVNYFHINLGSEYQVLVLKTEDNRYFIPGISNSLSPITNVGLHKDWFDAGKLLTPLFEYKNEKVDQTFGYGNDDMRSGNYVDMYKNYLSKVHLIRYIVSFLESR